MVRAYSIAADAIAAEPKRTGVDRQNVDFSHVIRRDTLECSDVGPGDVRLRILSRRLRCGLVL